MSSSDSETGDEGVPTRRVARPARPAAKRPSEDSDEIGDPKRTRKSDEPEHEDEPDEDTQPPEHLVIATSIIGTRPAVGAPPPEEAPPEDAEETRTEKFSSPPLSPRLPLDDDVKAGDERDETPARLKLAVPTLGLFSAAASKLSKQQVVTTSFDIVTAFLESHHDFDVILCEEDKEAFEFWKQQLESKREFEHFASEGRLSILCCNLEDVKSEAKEDVIDAAVAEITWRGKVATNCSHKLCELAVEGSETNTDSFLQDVKSKLPSGVAKVGFVTASDVPVTGLLRSRDGIKTLLFTCTVLSSGVEPNRKDKIDDPIEVLKTSWLAVLSFFAKQFGTGTTVSVNPFRAASSAPKNAFVLLMDSAKQKSLALKTQSESVAVIASGPRTNFKSKSDNFLDGLRKYITHPEKWLETEWSDNDLVIIPDGYPKASRHYLVMPRNGNLNSITELRKQHIPLLEKMKLEATRHIIKKAKNVLAPFVMGFHAVPSMNCLHMHVLTSEFNGACLKRKEHWNSFTTAFFRPVDDIIKELRDEGQVFIDVKMAEGLKRGEMSCPQHNNIKFKNMPELKEHLDKFHPY